MPPNGPLPAPLETFEPLDLPQAFDSLPPDHRATLLEITEIASRGPVVALTLDDKSKAVLRFEQLARQLYNPQFELNSPPKALATAIAKIHTLHTVINKLQALNSLTKLTARHKLLFKRYAKIDTTNLTAYQTVLAIAFFQDKIIQKHQGRYILQITGILDTPTLQVLDSLNKDFEKQTASPADDIDGLEALKAEAQAELKALKLKFNYANILALESTHEGIRIILTEVLSRESTKISKLTPEDLDEIFSTISQYFQIPYQNHELTGEFIGFLNFLPKIHEQYANKLNPVYRQDFIRDALILQDSDFDYLQDLDFHKFILIVQETQKLLGFPPTGYIDEPTGRALHQVITQSSKLDATQKEALKAVTDLLDPSLLYNPDSNDPVILMKAIKALQTENKLPPTGLIDEQVLKLLQ